MNRWDELVRSVNTWKRGSQRAPHKPLLTLLLLARAQHGLPPALSYAEIEAPLNRALREFGPPRKSYHAEYPFWHRQSDGFWLVRDADALPYRTGNKYPTRTTLVREHVVGEVPAELWGELTRDPALVPRLAQYLLDEYWPESLHGAITTHFGLDLHPSVSSEEEKTGLGPYETVLRQRRDPAFRVEVLRAYERRCAVCGYDGRLGDDPFGLDAAHIQWHAYGGPDQVTNGLALCSLHHIAFDRGAIGLDEQRRVLVSQDVCGGDAVGRALLDYNGAPLTGPQSDDFVPGAAVIEWHGKNVFRGPARRRA